MSCVACPAFLVTIDERVTLTESCGSPNRPRSASSPDAGSARNSAVNATAAVDRSQRLLGLKTFHTLVLKTLPCAKAFITSTSGVPRSTKLVHI